MKTISRLFLSTYLLLAGTSFSLGQVDESLFKAHIDTLCSDSLAGRGYVLDGHLKASNYVAKQFARMGLVALGDSYFQEFDMTVNTVPLGGMRMSMGARSFEEGRDYIMKSCSGPISGLFELCYAQNPKELERLLKKGDRYWKNRALVYPKELWNAGLSDYALANIDKPAVHVVLSDGLLLSVSSSQSCAPTIVLKKDLWRGQKQIRLKLQPVVKSVVSRNVIAVHEGQVKDTFMIVCAHYDHLGMQGNAIYRGANDNASGTAMMLCLADSVTKTQERYGTIFIAFGGEEAGLIGSRYYVANPVLPLAGTRFVLNLDLWGSGSKGVAVVNATEHPSWYEGFVHSARLFSVDVQKRGPAPNSDHYPFTLKGVPTFFIYAKGDVGGYHDVNDVPEALEEGEFARMFRLLWDF